MIVAMIPNRSHRFIGTSITDSALDGPDDGVRPTVTVRPVAGDVAVAFAAA